jgi:glycosyltransferase involved in cell wall biosynthesis
MAYEIVISAGPGEARRERDRLASLFRRFGADVRLVSTSPDPGGAIPYERGMFADRTVVGVSDPALLARLPEVREHDRPAKVVWCPAGAAVSDDVRQAYVDGLIDVFAFAGEETLSTAHAARVLVYPEIVDLDAIPWRPRVWGRFYGVGHLGAAAAPDDEGVWRLADRLLLPRGLDKCLHILGRHEGFAKRLGRPPRGLAWKAWTLGTKHDETLFGELVVLLVRAGALREASSTFVLEACAHGVVPIVEESEDFTDLVLHGETGFRARSLEELSYYAGHLAMRPEEHRRLAQAARAHVEARVNLVASWEAWRAELASTAPARAVSRAQPPAPPQLPQVQQEPRAMGKEVWIAGFHNAYGGASTELDHLLDLLLAHDVRVNVVAVGRAMDAESRRALLARGCAVHDNHPRVFKDRTVLSFCNAAFLEQLLRTAGVGRPERVFWFNCMTHTLPGEPNAHRRGLLDYFGFVSEYQRRLLTAQLAKIRPVKTFEYRPYLNLSRAEWRYRSPDGTYRMGRISRDDHTKFAPDTWRIFDRVIVPPALRKKVYILGYGARAATRIGRPPPGLDATTWRPGEIPAADFYRSIDTMVHKTGGSRESYCRVLVEAYAHGVVPVVENDYAFPELVVHGETGFLASSSDEMSYWASYLAMNPAEHRRIAENGRDHVAKLVDPEACWKCWEAIL